MKPDEAEPSGRLRAGGGGATGMETKQEPAGTRERMHDELGRLCARVGFGWGHPPTTDEALLYLVAAVSLVLERVEALEAGAPHPELAGRFDGR